MDILDLIPSAVKYPAVIFIPYCLLIIIYRIFFHPLRKYPGPFLAKLSGIYTGFYALLRRLHLTTYLDQKKYGGPVLRHGPNKLVFNSVEALQDIYNNERVTKSHVYELTMRSGKPSIFSTIDKQQHRLKRKLIGQAVNDKATRVFEPTMIEQVDIFIEQLMASSQDSNPVDMTERCKWLGMDIVGLLAFGFALNMQTDPTYRFVTSGLSVETYQMNSIMQWPLLNTIGFHHLLLLVGYGQRVKYLRALQTMISTRLSQEKHAKNDLYSSVADHLDNAADGITTSELWSEALFFFPAAGDTTTTALSALFFYLSRYREVYKKLADEIRRSFSSTADIKSGPQLSSCRYLRACIDEALRMSPPIAGTLWRELPPAEHAREPWIVDGHVVPQGTQVGVCMYALHHNEAYFADPFIFRPERWLDENGDPEALSRMHAAFSPFSVGSRACAGKHMAYLEASLVIAKTLFTFDFWTAQGEAGHVGAGVPGRTDGRGRPHEFQLYDTFGSQHVGPNLIFRRRGEFGEDIGKGVPWS
ncbi:cytochrome P450 [Daldinia decipiens]|uniref:cytochrome P450 n=1 Tax=Daldinia decipiens TaxID=326647 RepID=UPI0020C46B66|nr:cytochrome P450 [Daldinia decipiens]KAI1662176.1 cytochrome P450 [Daldinia decipiens]